MKLSGLLLNIIITCPGLLFFAGCNPYSTFVLDNDNSIKQLNEMVKDYDVRVTTKHKIYESDNLIIRRDSTLVENYITGTNIPVTNINQLQPSSESFPTNQLIKIQKRNHTAAAYKGLVYGAGGGAFSGLIIGAILGVKDNSGAIPVYDPNSGTQSLTSKSKPISQYIILGTVGGTIIGGIVGAVIGAIIGQWEDIDIIYKLEKSN
jgi:hypothetical protein